MNRPPFFIILITFLLAGCVNHYIDHGGRMHFIPPTGVEEKLQQATSCCKHFSEIHFQKVELGRSYEFIIDDSLPVFEFKTGKSYVVGIELPKYYKSYDLVVESYFDETFFYPNVAVLNEKFFIVKSVAERGIHFENQYHSLSNAYVAGKITLNEMNETSDYLLIYTTDRLKNKKIVVNPAAVNGYDVHPGPVGRIKLYFYK